MAETDKPPEASVTEARLHPDFAPLHPDFPETLPELLVTLRPSQIALHGVRCFDRIHGRLPTAGEVCAFVRARWNLEIAYGTAANAKSNFRFRRWSTAVAKVSEDGPFHCSVKSVYENTP